ncbi:MAG: hypothetical protein HY205_00830 [Nitrospirae bacterium]|nr:hypothetical protein [Nitrospirota bacterium]
MSLYSLRTILTILSIGFCAVSLVWANPAMLPKHPGYPAGHAVSPVTGQPLANDPGQTNASGENALLEAATADDGHVAQNLMDENNQRIVQKEGAGQLPKVQGPDIKIEPPVKEATKMK